MARKVLEKKFKRSKRRHHITSEFYDKFSRKLDSWYENFGFEYEKDIKTPSARFMPLRWYKGKYEALISVLADIKKDVETTRSRLQNPNFIAELAESAAQCDKMAVMTYNIYQLIGTPNRSERVKRLINYLKNKPIKVIAIQEAFQI